MTEHRLSRSATGARVPRAVLLLGAVVVSLVACSTDGPSATDSVVAIEEARAEAAAEVAEVQAAIDRQVAAADARQAEAEAEDEARQAPAVPADGRAEVSRAAAAKVAADRAAAAKAAAGRAAARKAAADAAATAGAQRLRRTPPIARKATPPGTSAKQTTPPRTGAKALPPPARPSKPVATPASRGAAVPKPAIPTSRPAATPAGRPQNRVSFANDLVVVVVPGGTVTTPGDDSVAAGCQPRDFHAGERVRLTTGTGVLVHETVLPECQREVISAPGTGVAITSPRFAVTLPKIAWRSGDAWVLEIGMRSWPVTASTLSEYGWSIAVSAQTGITAGPPAVRRPSPEVLGTGTDG